jgi:hypothetical protein
VLRLNVITGVPVVLSWACSLPTPCGYLLFTCLQFFHGARTAPVAPAPGAMLSTIAPAETSAGKAVRCRRVSATASANSPSARESGSVESWAVLTLAGFVIAIVVVCERAHLEQGIGDEARDPNEEQNRQAESQNMHRVLPSRSLCSTKAGSLGVSPRTD